MREYLETFFRRKWLFFVPFLVVLAIAVAGGLYTSWLYEVQARLEVQGNPLLDQAGQQLSMPQADVKDEYSRLSDLLLTDDFVKSVVNSVPALKSQSDTPAKMDATVARLHRDLNAWEPGASLINFRFRDRDPQVAQQVVSKTIDLFLAQRYADRVGKADQAITFLGQQQTVYQQQLQQAGTALGAWETSHPPAGRATLPESQQLQYQGLKTGYDSVLSNLQYISGELEKARFSKDKAIAAQSSTYVLRDPPVVPASPALSLNRMLGLILVGLAVAAGLGFCIVAITTWLGAGRTAPGASSALPSWVSRMTAEEEQPA